MDKSGPKWRRQPDKRPKQIMDAALKVFGNKGFMASTMEEIAQEAGVTKGTIYLYFRNKEGLFVQTIRNQFQRALDLLPRITFAPDADPETLARDLGKEFLDVMMTPEVAKTIPLIIGEIRHLPILKTMYQDEILAQANIRLAKILELGMNLGLIRRMDPIIAARCLFGMLMVFVLTQEVLGAKEVTPMTTDDIAETAAGIYFHGILERGKG